MGRVKEKYIEYMNGDLSEEDFKIFCGDSGETYEEYLKGKRVLDMYSRTKKSLAISSKTEDDAHILVWDFDNIDIYHVLKSLSKSQNINGLGIIYIFESKHGYNAICLDKLFIKEAHNIKFFTRWSDYQHTQIGYQQGNWAWRVDGKKFVDYLLPTDAYKNRIQSYAHKLYLEKTFGVDVFVGDFDEYKIVDMESYPLNVI